MARWIIHRPQEHCHASEIRVAEVLKELDDRWTIIWGYFYRDARGTDREGDFLVIGPAGGLLVLEVKSSIPRWFAETGHWEGEAGSPVDQLISEWAAVRRMLKKAGSTVWVAKALCIADELASRELENCQGIPRQLLVLRNDLDHWLRTWLDLFRDKVSQPVLPPERDRVLAVFGASVQPAARRGFLDHTEQLFQRQLTSQFALLDQLRDNRQILVRGGTGTGKTWHALEQAFRYARAGEGRRVLFLVYNLALTAQLKRLVAMRRLDQGEVVVYSWEELFRELAGAGEVLPNPASGSDTESWRDYYEIQLPGRVRAISGDVAARAKWPSFDALVVDEGQDHDTAWPNEAGSAGETDSGGWWDIYRLLLRQGGEAPASIFYDPAQRPPFRARERFDAGVLAAGWSQPCHVHLQPAVRYTRPLWSFLQDHRHAAIAPMLDALGRGDHLPEGPTAEKLRYRSPDEALALIEEIITRWKKSGLCEPEEVLILHKQSDIARSALGERRVLLGRNLREVTESNVPADSIRHTSINKAKGLDARAVILLGLPPFADCDDDFTAYTWFMGASRARQLLAVVEVCAGDE
jgi:hypothetical protein